jgi:hypothetical protein
MIQFPSLVTDPYVNGYLMIRFPSLVPNPYVLTS